MFEDYYATATKLKEKYKSQVELFVGFETEFCRPESLEDVKQLLKKYCFDYFVGSVHHVREIPIDFNREKYDLAVEACGGRDALYLEYFDAVRKLILELKPPVVGHLDLIRLMEPEASLSSEVIAAAAAAIDEGVRANCLFELNTSGLRKGLPGPYPRDELLNV